MPPPDFPLFPLLEIEAVANPHNAWVALALRVLPVEGDLGAALGQVFGAPDLLAAVAPLDCILMLDSPLVLGESLCRLMPPGRVGLAFAAAALEADADRKRMLALHDQGYRILVDGSVAQGTTLPAGLRGVARDCSAGVPSGAPLAAVFGPHLAHGVDSAARRDECALAGFDRFCGDYPLHPAPGAEQQDGSSRKRLLSLIGLVSNDADSKDIEAQLKQDPALSYHLLKLANSAAFVHSTPITSFGQAISLLGRRQLQRWLQLLLYARQQPDGMANPLLPIAALRAAQVEALCKLRGGDRDEQDLAFMTGVFSLLDLLFGMPMAEIVQALNLAPAAADALLARAGPLGTLLRLSESRRVGAATLDAARISPRQWWQTQLHAYHWAIQVSRNL